MIRDRNNWASLTTEQKLDTLRDFIIAIENRIHPIETNITDYGSAIREIEEKLKTIDGGKF